MVELDLDAIEKAWSDDAARAAFVLKGGFAVADAARTIRALVDEVCRLRVEQNREADEGLERRALSAETERDHFLKKTREERDRGDDLCAKLADVVAQRDALLAALEKIAEAARSKGAPSWSDRIAIDALRSRLEKGEAAELEHRKLREERDWFRINLERIAARPCNGAMDECEWQVFAARALNAPAPRLDLLPQRSG